MEKIKIKKITEDTKRKPNIILADTDASYSAALHLLLVCELSDTACVHSITDEDYYNQHLRTHPDADILVVSQELYTRYPDINEIKHIFVLTENEEYRAPEQEGIEYIYKYLPLQEVFRRITGRDTAYIQLAGSFGHGTGIIVVYSPAGGTGKTSIALGAAAALSETGKKTLYIDAEELHTFQYYLSDRSCISSESLYQKLQSHDLTDIYDVVKGSLGNEGFTYLPPFMASAFSLNIDLSIYEKLVRGAADSGEYDFIIVDTDSVLNEQKVSLLSLADKVLLVLNQEERMAFAVSKMSENIDGVNSEKYIPVCNDFHSDRDNIFNDRHIVPGFHAPEYIRHIRKTDDSYLSAFISDEGIKRIVQLII